MPRNAVKLEFEINLLIFTLNYEKLIWISVHVIFDELKTVR